MKGNRKFALGMTYLIGIFALGGLAVVMDKSAGLVGAVSSFAVTVATGLGVIVWGNREEHRLTNKGDK